MTAAFAGRGWDVVFDAEVGRSTLAGARTVASRRPTPTDSLVVSLGANDAGSLPLFRRRVDQVLAAAGPAPHIYWLTIREVRPYYAPANGVLREAAARHPNLTVLDWNAASNGPGLTARDGLHLTPPGARAMTDTVTAAVLAAATTTTTTTTTTSTTTAVPTTVPTTVPRVERSDRGTASDPVLESSDRPAAAATTDPWWRSAPWSLVLAVIAVGLVVAAGLLVGRRGRRRRRARARARRIASARESSHGNPHKT